MAAVTLQKNSKIGSTREKKRIGFYILMFALPLLQFAIFYIYVNLNSIILSFQKYAPVEHGIGYTSSFVGFDNFVTAFKFIFSPECWDMIKYSIIYYCINLFLITPLALIFSFYIAKKYPLGGFFRVMLYLPSVLSAVVLAVLYRYIVSNAIPQMVKELTGTTMFQYFGGKANAEQQFKIILLYNLFLAFGTNTMLYVGAMSDINPSLIEAAKIDGAGPVRQFIHVYVPMIWPTLVTFIVTGLTGIFIEQMNLYSFFGGGLEAAYSTFGYFFYVQSTTSDLVLGSSTSAVYTFSELAAMGLVITVIIIPIVLTVRKLLNKYGPSAK